VADVIVWASVDMLSLIRGRRNQEYVSTLTPTGLDSACPSKVVIK
jgi:hypothetical protein